MSSLYIGLGGIGIDAVKAIYGRNQGNEISCSKDKYLLIDTDVHSRKDLPEILQRSFIDIGAKSPTQIIEEALNSLQKEWFLNWYDYYEGFYIEQDQKKAVCWYRMSAQRLFKNAI
jgi:TPR repeat protein